MKILFWNFNRGITNEVIEELITDNDCDIVSLAEYRGNARSLLKTLSIKGYNYYHVPNMGCERIELFTKFEPSKVTHIYDMSYYTIKSFPHPLLGKIMITFVHFPSKLYCDDFDYLEESKLVRAQIEKEELISNSNNTMVIGDFNMNPFEEGMLAAAAFNAFPTIHEVEGKARTVKGRDYNLFYNPMWRFFGDFDQPFGTYYYNAAKHYTIKWNIFDQVLMRPNLMEFFVTDSLKIITETKSHDLTNKNFKPSISDHLPIYFEI